MSLECKELLDFIVIKMAVVERLGMLLDGW